MAIMSKPKHKKKDGQNDENNDGVVMSSRKEIKKAALQYYPCQDLIGRWVHFSYNGGLLIHIDHLLLFLIRPLMSLSVYVRIHREENETVVALPSI